MSEVIRRKRTSLQDIALKVGVDASTVSLVLNRKPLAAKLKEETRKRIELCARELNYRPSRAARTLRSGKSGMVGIVVGDISSIFYSEMTATALQVAESLHLQLLVAATRWAPEQEHNALKNLLDTGVDGIIFLPGSLAMHEDLLKVIRQEAIPVVTFDYRLDGTSGFFSDYKPGMEQAVAALVPRHTRIGCLVHRSDQADKAEPFLAACRKYQVEGVLLKHTGFDFEDYPAGVDLKQLFAPEMPKAWIVCGGECAVFVLNESLRRGFRVPEEYEWIGLGCDRLGHFTCPGLAQIVQDPRELMQAAFQLLQQREGEIRIPTRFETGNSIQTKELHV